MKKGSPGPEPKSGIPSTAGRTLVDEKSRSPGRRTSFAGALRKNPCGTPSCPGRQRSQRRPKHSEKLSHPFQVPVVGHEIPAEQIKVGSQGIGGAGHLLGKSRRDREVKVREVHQAQLAPRGELPAEKGDFPDTYGRGARKSGRRRGPGRRRPLPPVSERSAGSGRLQASSALPIFHGDSPPAPRSGKGSRRPPTLSINRRFPPSLASGRQLRYLF